MPNIYSSQIATGARLLKAKGQLVTLYRINPGTYNPLDPSTAVPFVDTQCSGYAVVLPASRKYATILGLDNDLTSRPEKFVFRRYVILSAKGITFMPLPNDLLKTAEGTYRLIGCNPLNPNGAEPILYELGCILDIAFDPDAEVEEPTISTFDSSDVLFDSNLVTIDSE